MEYQREFEKIDTIEKAYLIGLFYADGCVVSNTDVKNLNTNAVRISITDEQLINDLYKIFPFFNKGSFDFSKYNPNCLVQYSLSKKNKQLSEDFYSAGVIPRKSAENSEQLFIPKIEKHLISHFIRGYFDGNGSISIPTARPNLRRVEICSTSKTLIEDIKRVLETNNINCPIYRVRGNKIPLYILEWVNTKDIIAFKNYIYRKSNFHLERKKKLFDTFEPYTRGEGNPICSCGGTLMKNGTRQTKYILYNRYKCKKCKKNTQLPCPL